MTETNAEVTTLADGGKPETIGYRATPIERAMLSIKTRASSPETGHLPSGQARAWLAICAAEAAHDDDTVRNELGSYAFTIFRLISESPSATFQDVAAKLAIGYLETVAHDGSEGSFRKNALLGSALADLVILNGTPLPDGTALATMTAADCGE